jgi:hypothetical protein
LAKIGKSEFAPYPIDLKPILLLSFPTQMMVTKFGIRATNQASLLFCIVPVLPAIAFLILN